MAAERKARLPSEVSIELLRSAVDEIGSLVSERLPLQLDKGEMWPVVAAGFLARANGVLASLTALAEERRTADAQILLRVLLEHVTVFCWLGIDPEPNVEEWQEWEHHRLISLHRDAEKFGVDVLSGNELEEFGQRKAPRSMAELTLAVDEHWSARSPAFRGHPEDGSRNILTFRGFYTTVYRRGSRLVHPAVLGIERHMTEPLAGRVTVRVGQTEDTVTPGISALAIPLMAMLLTVYAVHFGWPDLDRVRTINESIVYYGDA
jgi:hypothetical protein